MTAVRRPARGVFPLAWTAKLPPLAQEAMLTIAGGFVGLAVARMAYIVWRDYDVVRLQKKLNDESADREALAKASEEALSKVTAIRASGLQPGPKPNVSAWKE